MKHKTSIVTGETNIGIYVWQLPNGDFLIDDDLNVLSVNARRGDLWAITNITKVARSLGFEGQAVFSEGNRKISEEEFQEQRYRMSQGLVPDPLDIGVYKDELRDRQWKKN